MEKSAKTLLIVALAYNVGLGYVIFRLSSAPLLLLVFLAADIFFIFLLMWHMGRDAYKTYKFKRQHRFILDKARDEIEEQEVQKELKG